VGCAEQTRLFPGGRGEEEPDNNWLESWSRPKVEGETGKVSKGFSSLESRRSEGRDGEKNRKFSPGHTAGEMEIKILIAPEDSKGGLRRQDRLGSPPP